MPDYCRSSRLTLLPTAACCAALLPHRLQPETRKARRRTGSGHGGDRRSRDGPLRRRRQRHGNAAPDRDRRAAGGRDRDRRHLPRGSGRGAGPGPLPDRAAPLSRGVSAGAGDAGARQRHGGERATGSRPVRLAGERRSMSPRSRRIRSAPPRRRRMRPSRRTRTRSKRPGSASTRPRSARRSAGAPAASWCGPATSCTRPSGTPLVVINQIRPILVRFAVPGSELPLIQKYGAEKALPVAAVPGRSPLEAEADTTLGAPTGPAPAMPSDPPPSEALAGRSDGAGQPHASSTTPWIPPPAP